MVSRVSFLICKQNIYCILAVQYVWVKNYILRNTGFGSSLQYNGAILALPNTFQVQGANFYWVKFLNKIGTLLAWEATIWSRDYIWWTFVLDSGIPGLRMSWTFSLQLFRRIFLDSKWLGSERPDLRLLLFRVLSCGVWAGWMGSEGRSLGKKQY